MERSVGLTSSCFVALVICTAAWLLRRLVVKSPGPYPPGPRPFPLLGNFADIPSSYQWKTYSQWRRRWGDIISVSMCGQRTIILNSLEAANDLLDKRGAIHADRLVSYLAGKIMGWDQTLTQCPYDSHCRSMRRVLQRHLGGQGQTGKIDAYHDLIESEATKFLSRMLEDPDNLIGHIRRTTGATILRIAYGHAVADGRDPTVELIDRAMNGFHLASTSGTCMVENLPVLRWIPKWLYLYGWKQKAERWRTYTQAMIEVPYKKVKTNAARRAENIGLVGRSITEQPFDEDDEYTLKLAAASLYPGGVDMMSCAISNFFLAMVLYPEVQRKAQRELDHIIGVDRMPHLSDQPRLPYINALCSEVYRWNPVAPLGIPHCSAEDDYYQGYFIPRGSLLVVNVWHILRDPDVYFEPLSFKPERFIGEQGKRPERDPRSVAFGFGRRTCAGINLAEATLFTTCAMSLAMFDITKAVEDGKEVIPSVLHGPGPISHPLPFKCKIRPRTSVSEKLIRQATTSY